MGGINGRCFIYTSFEKYNFVAENKVWERSQKR